MFTTKDAFDAIARPRPGDRLVRSWWTSGRILGAVVVGSAVLAALAVRQPGVLAVLLGAGTAVLAYRWVAMLARRDARALLVLWLVFAVNRTAALLLPGGLSAWALRIDDLSLATALGVVLVTGVRRRDLRLPGRTVSAGVAAFAICGIVSALLADVPVATVTLGTWLALKLWVCVGIALQFSWTARDIAWAKRIVVGAVVIVLSVAAVQLLQPELVSRVFGREARTRVGATVVTSIFRQPFQYSVFLLLAVSLILSPSPLRFGRGVFGVVAAVFALLSLRLKALVDLVLMLATGMLTAPRRVVRLWAPAALLVAGSAALYLGSDLLSARLSVLFGGADESPRQVLYRTAVAIAGSRFPLGSGFGTFGSDASREQYSHIYVEYGLSTRFGFSPKAPVYVTDASWATALGEAGWIGAAGFAVALTALALRLLRQVRAGGTVGGEHPGRAGLLFIVAFISDSMTSPQLFSGFGCISLAIVVSMSASLATSRGRTAATEQRGGPMARSVGQEPTAVSGARARPGGTVVAPRGGIDGAS